MQRILGQILVVIAVVRQLMTGHNSTANQQAQAWRSPNELQVVFIARSWSPACPRPLDCSSPVCDSASTVVLTNELHALAQRSAHRYQQPISTHIWITVQHML